MDMLNIIVSIEKKENCKDCSVIDRQESFSTNIPQILKQNLVPLPYSYSKHSRAVPVLLNADTSRAPNILWLELAVAVELPVPLQMEVAGTAVLEGKSADTINCKRDTAGIAVVVDNCCKT
jgi:hypothetical protein